MTEFLKVVRGPQQDTFESTFWAILEMELVPPVMRQTGKFRSAHSYLLPVTSFVSVAQEGAQIKYHFIIVTLLNPQSQKVWRLHKSNLIYSAALGFKWWHSKTDSNSKYDEAARQPNEDKHLEVVLSGKLKDTKGSTARIGIGRQLGINRANN